MMKRKHQDFKLVPFPKMRRVLSVMFGKGSGWGIPTAAHTLDITLGGIGEKPIIIDGRLETREYLNMTISMDHDIIDGAPATRFALRLKELIESGYGLIDQVSVLRQSTFRN